MGLGNRDARRHQTQRTAGVDPEIYWDFKPGQTVMTVDGFLGKVEAVFDGMVAGHEEYQVTLHNGLGGGLYTSGQLRSATDKTAKENTASVDYPELSEILQERLDPGKYPHATMGLTASKHQAEYYTADELREVGRAEAERQGMLAEEILAKQAEYTTQDFARTVMDKFDALQAQAEVGGKPGMCENGHLTWGGECASCRNADVGENAMVVNPGDHKPQDVEKTGARMLLAAWSPGGHEECGQCSSIMHTTDEHDLFESHGQGGNLNSEEADELRYEHIPQVQAPEGDAFAVTRCEDHGTKGTGDLRSQHHYLDFAHDCHDAEPHSHEPGVSCWSCCPNMQIAHPGELESGKNYTAAKTAGMFGMPLFEQGDRVINFRGEGGIVDHVRDSGHPGKSNKVSVTYDGEEPGSGLYGTAYNEQVFEPHPDAPQEQKDRYHQRKADNQAASDLLDSIEEKHQNVVWPHEGKTATTTDEQCSDCGSYWHSTNEHTDDNSDEGLIDDEDEGRFESTCPLCGNNRMEDGSHPYNGVGPNDECPNGRGRGQLIEEQMEKLPAEKYCSEHCQSAHAQDLVTGFADHEETAKNEANGACRHCGGAMLGSPQDEISRMGDPKALHFLKTNPTGPTKYSALERGYVHLRQAALDPSFGFHFTAAWRDVRAKAQRIRREGGVHLTAAQNGYYIAQVKGDHGTYESVLMRAPGSRKIAQWDCGCKWAKYHWGAPDDYSRFAGRMCSHALALHFEAQSRGMFGREIAADEGAPAWLTERELGRTAAWEPEEACSVCHGTGYEGVPGGHPDAVRRCTGPGPHHDYDLPGNPAEQPANRRPGYEAPPSLFESKTGSLDYAPVLVFLAAAMEAGEDPAEVTALLSTVGAVSSPFGEPAPNPVPGIGPGGPTQPRTTENPASAGFLTAQDPDAWGQQNPQDLGDRVAARDEAMFEPELGKEAWIQAIPMALRALAPVIKQVAPKVLKTVAPAAVPKLLGEEDPREDEVDEEGEPTGQKQPSKVEDFARGLKGWTDRDKAEGDRVRGDQAARMAVLNDEPEPALPETFGADDDDETTYSGYAGDPEPDPKQAAISTGIEYAVPSDPGQSGGSLAPGTNLKSDPTDLEPEDPSFVSTGSVADIVAEFQRTAGASALATGNGQVGRDNAEIAQAAAAFLQKEAMAVFTPAQQAELINEGEGVKAANLDRLQIEGTHYESLQALMGDDDDDEEGWLS